MWAKFRGSLTVSADGTLTIMLLEVHIIIGNCVTIHAGTQQVEQGGTRAAGCRNVFKTEHKSFVNSPTEE
jgi:hypothetical protein